MGGPNGAEVALIERRHLRLAEAFGKSDDAGIDDTKREIAIARLQLSTADQVGTRRRLQAVDPGEQVIEEDEPRLRREPTAAPIVELGEDEGRHDEVLVGAREKPGAGLVIGIRGVERGQQRTCVADEGHFSAVAQRPVQR